MLNGLLLFFCLSFLKKSSYIYIHIYVYMSTVAFHSFHPYLSLSLCFFVCQCPYACLPFSSSFMVYVGVWTVIWKDVRDLLVAVTRSMGKNRKGGISIWKECPSPFPLQGLKLGRLWLLRERERNVGVLPLPYFPSHVASTYAFGFRERCFAWARRDKNVLFQITGAVFFFLLCLYFILFHFLGLTWTISRKWFVICIPSMPPAHAPVMAVVVLL